MTSRPTASPAGPVRRDGFTLAPFVARVLMCSVLALPASGCALSFPMAGFAPDPMVTGSTDKSDALLFKALDQEDFRRAKAAMAVALDPQGNGASVTWENPTSGAKGSFVAVTAPVAKADTICRDFRAHMVPDAAAGREVNGSACRSPDGDWAVRQAAEVGKPMSSGG